MESKNNIFILLILLLTISCTETTYIDKTENFFVDIENVYAPEQARIQITSENVLHPRKIEIQILICGSLFLDISTTIENGKEIIIPLTGLDSGEHNAYISIIDTKTGRFYQWMKNFTVYEKCISERCR